MKFHLFISAARNWRNRGQELLRTTNNQGHVILKVDDSLHSRFRNLLKYFNFTKMNLVPCTSVSPPSQVQGMTTLDRKAFSTKVQLPGLKVPKSEINATQKIWKSCIFKMWKVKPIGELGNNDPQRETHSLILLDPEKLTEDKLLQHQTTLLEKFGFDLTLPTLYEVDIHYENWSVSDIFRAVLPSDADNVSSFSQVGHIAHLNLKPESLPYKNLIGEVLIDKMSTIKTVVNKLSSIDNTFRNFQMELLAGEDNFVTKTKEHNCIFELDFSKVYWNSRLSTEHQRVTDYIPNNSLVYDVFAGIGPFSVPLAKRKQCLVWANDLNPHSFEYLNKNFTLNKVNLDRVKTYNLDGRDFIKTVIKDDLIKRLKKMTESDDKDNLCDEQSECKSFVIMNLPAIAVEFLSEFNALLCDLPHNLRSAELLEKVLPEVICYAFTPKIDADAELKPRAENFLGCSLPANYSCRIVRNVSPNKEMVCLSFKLWPDLVLQTAHCIKGETICMDNKYENEPEAKRLKCS